MTGPGEVFSGLDEEGKKEIQAENDKILSEVMSKPVQQITDQRTLRKLLRRVEEIVEVKTYLEAVAARLPVPPSPTNTPILEVKKVKENQHMTALLTEIKTYLEANDSEAASKAARRVLEANPIKPPEKFVKENSNLALASGSIEPVSE